MDTLKLLMDNANTILVAITSLITIASLVTAGTKTPKKGTKLYRLYKIIESIALVIHKAKDEGDDDNTTDAV